MPLTEDTEKIEQIVEGASKLSLKGQEHILEVMKAMIFTRNIIEKKNENKDLRDTGI